MDAVILNSGPVYPRKWYIFRSIGAYKIARALRQEGYECQVIDFVNFISEEDLILLLKKFVNSKTKILGLSSTFLLIDFKMSDHVVNAIKYILDLYPNLKLVIGGAHPRISAEVVNKLKKKYVCVTGYGEDIIVELMNFYNSKGLEPLYELEFNTYGVHRVYNSARSPKHNIETDNHLFSDQDCILPNETLPIEISRGCIFKCKFCNHLLLGRGKLDYLRNIELVKNELTYNYEKWKTQNYYVICDTFNDTEYKMKMWYNMISNLPFKIQYVSYLRADLLERYPDVPYMLAESGLMSCFHGIESLGPGSKIVGKGWSEKRAREYIPELYHSIWKKQVYQTIGIIVGLPGDTKETYLDTLDWFDNNDLYCLNPSPLHMYKHDVNKNKSEFEKNYEKYGYHFPNPNDPTFWKNEYWSQKDAIQLLRDTAHRLKKTSSKLGSWFTMVPLQYGYTKEDVDKEKESLLSDYKLTILANEHIARYVEKLKLL